MNIMVSIRHISRSPISGYIIRGTLCRECNNNSIHWWRLGGGRRGGGDLVPSWAGGRSSTPPPTLSHGHLQFGEINYKISGWAGVREGGRKRDGEREENPKMCPFHLIAHEASNLEQTQQQNSLSGRTLALLASTPRYFLWIKFQKVTCFSVRISSWGDRDQN